MSDLAKGFDKDGIPLVVSWRQSVNRASRSEDERRNNEDWNASRKALHEAKTYI